MMQGVTDRCPEAAEYWEPPDLSAIKAKLNMLVWENARPDVTLQEADKAAGRAFEAIWPLLEPKKESP